MGMFDYIKCEYPLPLPTDLGEAKDVDFNGLIYQTKDLNNSLESYKIDKDGNLWIKETETEWIEGNPNGKTFSERFGHAELIKEWLEPITYTGEVVFYEGLQYSEQANDDWKNDYWVEYKAIFVAGKIVKIELVSFDKKDNTERKNSIKELHEKMKKREVLWNKWYMKYLYVYYDMFMEWIFRQYRKIIVSLPASYKIERWFRPL
jgi:hypothetical protein